jgi:outer membrane cobalamin receptor
LEDGAARPAHVTLELTALFEEVQVTSPGELPPAEPGVSTMVFTVPPLRTRAALTIDDALKMVPGFTLGRRSSSRVANPGSQGLTLRGLGGSGASRSAVLTDGVPLNDAFAGWVYWDKVPQSAIDRIEVLRGGGSDRDATDALGGIVQIVTVRPGRAAVRALVEGGSLATGRLSLFAGGQRRGWSISGAGEWFTTDGYITVPEDERGPIDTPAGSRHRSAFTAVSYQATNGWRFDARGNLFSEDRRNGTPAQVNDTSAGHASGEVSGIVGGGFLTARLYSIAQRHAQTFSVI